MNQTDLERRAEERRVQALVRDVEEDFSRRRAARRELERGWELNMNFFSGNQYCDVAPNGEIAEEDKRFYWQSRRVFNHIAPTVETRCAKLEKNRPSLQVRASSDEDADIKCARLASDILRAAGERIGLDGVISRATLWSEVCGTAFYKIVWDAAAGAPVAEGENGRICEGDVRVTPVSPFEIFPDSLSAERMEDVHSLIHAKAVPVREIFEKFGVRLSGRDISEFSLSPYSVSRHWKTVEGEGARLTEEGYEIVIERYTMPDFEHKNGKLEIVAGGKLLYEGVLPYENGDKGTRKFPFARQVSLPLPGAFFGASVVDRLIPLQRAYNAVRNRKHEFLNRLTMGVIAVEDGAVDSDELAEEGLSPGRVLVYRQGGKAPEMLDCGQIPAGLEEEEDRLEEEFFLISGVSDLSQNSTPARVTSATGLQLLLSQDDARLAATTDNLAVAQKELGRQIVRLYGQFAGNARLLAAAGENKRTEVVYFSAAELSADLVFETEEAATPEQKRETVLRLFEAGLLADADGNLSEENRLRILDAFGFGSYENAKDVSQLHVAKAAGENLALAKGEVPPDGYDDHALHVREHIRFLLSEELKGIPKGSNDRILRHVRAHEESGKISK